MMPPGGVPKPAGKDDPLMELLDKLTSIGHLTGDYDSMLKLIRQEEPKLPVEVLAGHPQRHMLNVVKGMAYAGKGDLERADEEYGKALKVNPRSGWAYFRRAQLRAGQGRNAAALFDLVEATAIKPRRNDFWLERGKAELALMKTDEALKSFEKAILCGDKEGWGWYGKSAALQLLERHNEALDAVRKAKGINPNEAEFARKEAKILDKLRD